MDRQLQEAVRQRARFRCEYCQFPAAPSELPFQIDHIIARKHGGQTDLSNLAFACSYCNSFKGPNLSGIDPVTGEMVRLFNPRRDVWAEHFRWDGALLFARTPVARATIQVLNLNHPDAVAVRRSLIAERVFPPLVGDD